MTKVCRPYQIQKLIVCVLLFLTFGYVAANESSTDLIIFFEQPGNNWETESLPIGNGKIGATILGNLVNDNIQFNEKTLWTGGPSATKSYNYGLPPYTTDDYLKRIEAVQNDISRQGSLTPKEVAERLGVEQENYGSYQSFGHLQLRFPGSHSQYSKYKRALDLNTAVAKVSYQSKGINYQREYFVSYPDNSLVIRLSADKPASINLSANISVPQNRTFQSDLVKPNELLVSGELLDNQLQYAAGLKVSVENGTLQQTNDGLVIKQADSVTLQLTAATNYALRHPNYRSTSSPRNKVNTQLAKNQTLSYADLLQRHLNDYQSLFSRVKLELNQSTPLAIDKMVAGYPFDNSKINQSLERIYYQYGRYLLIASSRAGSLPANLQGIWNKDIQAPWSADYHLNINLQMNYWLADMTNLTETLPPLFDYLDNLAVSGAQAAKQLFNSPGWVVFLNSNPWGSIGLIKWPTAFWQPEAAAWMAIQYYDHYLYTLDTTFLKQRAYPILKSASEFWLHNLVIDPQTKLLTVTPSYSPEHGYFTAGAAMSQQIIFDLFMKTITASSVVGDKTFQNKLQAAISQLDVGLRVGSWGQLQEWRQDLDKPNNHHRHVSHLYALHPGNHISPKSTPQFAAAASKTLNARGDGGTGWSKAWKINFWTRLLDGNRAYKLLQEQLSNSTLSNLWSNHPPFQIDGNFGATAGMTEMLLQSHLHNIHLLPALPAAWPHGQIQGLKARGNIEVSLQWQNHKLQKAVLKSHHDQVITLNNNEFNSSIAVLSDGKNIPFTSNNKDEISFTTLADQEYVVLIRQLNTTAENSLPVVNIK
ncbi:glycoside hydrolase family 95 protein [Paraglaciecola aquimarina]|uniref:Glycoside hydrolase family 95 protein n=1 Tax=Paraglaciecola algarum TaxID=3050085 RepID=A0ABS9D9G0_9ALTE|nr:glycoside hydrolase family 95 protein [Paraglaciecola sp. G1-23]MCF2949559.1 glycoside hydrolase family 95 protein [Paraglaciecola sp. G1-23]